MRNWLLWYLQIFPRPLIACVPHELVLACAKSKAYGVANTLFCCEIIGLEDHRVRVDDKFSSWLLVIKGVLQASVLGPLFLNVFMNSLFYFLKGECINAYADDVSDRDPLRLEKRLLCQIFSKVTTGLVWMVWLLILINIKEWLHTLQYSDGR